MGVDMIPCRMLGVGNELLYVIIMNGLTKRCRRHVAPACFGDFLLFCSWPSKASSVDMSNASSLLTSPLLHFYAFSSLQNIFIHASHVFQSRGIP